MALDFDARYKVASYPGIAWWLKGYIRTPLIDEETGEEIRVWVGECDDAYDINKDQVIAVMVGDDREHTIDVDELTEISEDEYCSICGQIGCGHG